MTNPTLTAVSIAKPNTNDNRDSDGKYTYGKPDRLCKCGRRLGDHDAERPFAFGDEYIDPRQLPDCAGFKPVRGGFLSVAERNALTVAAGLVVENTSEL